MSIEEIEYNNMLILIQYLLRHDIRVVIYDGIASPAPKEREE